MKKLLLTIIFLFILIVGCSDCPQKTGKELAQEKLLYELSRCNSKFGDNSYQNQREKNAAYCNQVLERVDKLVRDGYFDKEEVDNVEVPNITKPIVIDEDKQAYEELDAISNEIIGDI
jgi:hypothetical protein